VFANFRHIPEYVASFEDMIAIGWMGLSDAQRRFKKGKGTFEAYATICIKGKILDFLEKNWKHRNGNGHEIRYIYKQDNYYECKSACDVLIQAILCLPKHERKLIQDHYFRERTQAAIAKRKRCSPSFVSLQISRARMQLKEIMNGVEIPDFYPEVEEVVDGQP
jgi:RNA polymerase sigma factor (sigma-70 family)